jgi:hypothetical protein
MRLVYDLRVSRWLQILSGYQPCQLVNSDGCFRDQGRQVLIMKTEVIPETSVICNQLSWLIASSGLCCTKLIRLYIYTVSGWNTQIMSLPAGHRMSSGLVVQFKDTFHGI